MSCPEISPLVARFFDGELDGSHMRSVALHITRCRDCEGELRSLESLQDLIAEEIGAGVESVDTSDLWRSVAAQIGDQPVSWTDRLSAWWGDLEPFSSPMLGWQAAAAAAALAIGVLVLPGAERDAGDSLARNGTAAEQVEIATLVRDVADEVWLDNTAEFESIVGEVDQFMVDPDTHMAVLWVDEGGLR